MLDRGDLNLSESQPVFTGLTVDFGNIDLPVMLREVMRLTGLNQKQLAGCIGYQPEYLNHVLHRRRGLKSGRRIALAAVGVLIVCGVPVRFANPYKELVAAAKSPFKPQG